MALVIAAAAAAAAPVDAVVVGGIVAAAAAAAAGSRRKDELQRVGFWPTNGGVATVLRSFCSRTNGFDSSFRAM